jgi:hypothetical protein
MERCWQRGNQLLRRQRISIAEQGLTKVCFHVHVGRTMEEILTLQQKKSANISSKTNLILTAKEESVLI